MTGEELKARRARLGLTQKQMAEALGIPLNTLTRWEQGARIPRMSGLLERLLDYIEREHRQ